MKTTNSKYCTCLYHSANALSRVMTKISDEEFSITGLGSSYAFLLMTVNEKQGIQPKELSEQMQLTPSTVTRLIEKLEYKGYLKRESVGRSTNVFSTPRGIELQPKLKEVWRILYQRYTAILGKLEADTLTENIFSATVKLENEIKSNKK